MKQTILFYGNCQLKAVKNTLKLSYQKYNIINILCYETDITKEFFIEIIKNCDIIITQSIKDDYRGLDYLSTQFIINNYNKTSKIIIVDSCYFNFYYFDLTYKNINNEVLHLPIDYHYNKMFECYKNKLSVDYYVENVVRNDNFKTKEELEIMAKNSLDELEKRYFEVYNKFKTYDNVYFISTHDYIKNNYKDQLLFYSMNHPSKDVIQFISKELINILKIQNTIDYIIDELSHPKCILYNCVQKNVNFNIEDYLPLTDSKTNVYEITQLYYDTYKELGL